MSKQLIQASLNLDLAKSYNPAQDAVEQIGKAVDSYVKYEEQQSEKAYKISEGLQEGMVGFDLMSDQAQGYYEDKLQVVARDLASARARKDSKEVRRLLAEGKSLVEDQNKIGQIIYAHSQDKLSDNYVAGANTHVLDLLVNKNYKVKDEDGKRLIEFINAGGTNDFAPAGSDSQGNAKSGIDINDLDTYAIIKDPNIATNYLNSLNTIAKQAAAGKSYLNSPGQNSVNVTINDMLKDTDGLQNALFTRSFQLKDGNRIADLYYKDRSAENENLTMDEFVSKFMTPGRNDYDSEKLTEFVKQKLQDGALNHNNYYFEEDKNIDEFGDEKITGYSYVANVTASSGRQLQLDPDARNSAKKNILNKTREWQGSQGYYARLKGGGYLRYDTREDFLRDKKDGDLSSDQKQWDELFSGKSKWNTERYIDEQRIFELEVGVVNNDFSK
tara:strand:- start:1683 stop:3011 length:1329 start_codon:yes stop_codon:yes gene_type:complete